MFRQHIITVTAIVLLLVAISMQIFIKPIDRVGSTMNMVDLKENVEYLAISPMTTSLSTLERFQGIQSMLITEAVDMNEFKWFTLKDSDVNKADIDNLTYGSKLVRKGKEIRIIAPPTMLPLVPEKKEKGKNKDT